MVCHRPVPDDWKLKSVTVSQEPDGKYYVSVLFEYVTSIVEVPSKTILGLGGYQKGTGANFKRPPRAKFGTA